MPTNVTLPVLSIIIANRNYGRWIKDAIMSVAVDPYPTKQIFVTDDASTDNSWEVICKTIGIKVDSPKEGEIYKGKVLNTQVYTTHFDKPRKQATARNIGIQALFKHTHLFGILDADDIYLPGKIEKSVNKFLQCPQTIGAIYTDYDTINEESGLRLREYKEPFDRNRLMQACIVHSACFISALAIQTVGLFDEELPPCEDYDLWCRISEKFMICHIPESLMLVRVHKSNSTNTIHTDIWKQQLQRIGQKIQERRNGE